MKMKFLFFFLLLAHSVLANVIDSLEFGSFGKVKVYHPAAPPKQLVLFISGDGGWNTGVIDMALNFVDLNATVVGIDIRNYLKNLQKTKSECYYPAGDFENLSKFIQKKYHFRNYSNPVLIGYSSGATLIYGALAQAPANTFSGAIALGFCPDLQIPRPLCTGSGLKSHALGGNKGYYLEANNTLQEPFYALQGKTDQVCDFNATAGFLKGIPNARLIALNKVGHGFSVQKNWVPQMKQAYVEIMAKMVSEASKDKEAIEENQMKELPIHLTPATVNPEKPMVIFITGDGGYTSFDKSFCRELAANGMPVIALDALKYFWNEKTPASTTADVVKLINLYKNKWQKEKIILIGYSFGADVLPFVFNVMDKQAQEHVKLLVMLSPAVEADFEIHITDMLNISIGTKKYDVISEIDKMKNIRSLCIYGSEEDPEIKGKVNNQDISFEMIPGGHHYDNSFKELVEMIWVKMAK